MDNKLFVSVDMDDWYLARWATGSEKAIWSDLSSCFQNVYKQSTPPKNLYKPTDKILELFDSLNFKSTFFFTAYIAKIYPDLVKNIANAGHEIGCHNFYHLDYEYEDRQKFKKDLIESKQYLEDLSGQQIIGYRSPNSSIPKYLVEDLIEAEFKYDSSVTPTRRIMGKFGKFTNAPRKPYYTKGDDIGSSGNSTLMELPWAVFPYFKLPAGSGIMHRIGGNLYNTISVKDSLNRGHTSYYFHPYELNQLDELKNVPLPFKAKFFLRRSGNTYYENLKLFLTKNADRLINGENLFRIVRQEIKLG